MAECRLSLIRGSASLGAWLDACLAALPRHLTRAATLVLPSHRLAHHLRREACLRGEPGLLAGVRVRAPEELAREILLRAGVESRPALPALRVVALRALLGADGVPLVYLRPERLPDARSYAEAIARTITDLESAGLTPADLHAAAEKGGIPEDPVLSDRLRDIAALWEEADAQLLREDPLLRSPAGLLLAAAAELETEPTLAAPFGDIVVLLPLHPTSAVLRFIAALHPRAVGLLAGRPERDPSRRLRDGVAAALGAPLQEAAEGAETPRIELDLVHRYLFAAPEELARADRPRSRGPDGTVALEQYPGVQQEIDAAVGWAMEEVIERRTPLEAIALVVPDRDPLAGLLAAALQRSDKGGQPLPAYVAGGLPLTDAPGGTLLRQLLVALDEGLESERTIALLPRLRLTGPGHLTVADVRKVVQGSGVVGGTPGNLERARELAARLHDREAQLRTFLEETARLGEDDPEKVRRSRGLTEARRLRESIAAVLPAAEALTALAASVLDGTPLPELWPAIVVFYRDWCLAPPPPDAARSLGEAVREVCASPIASSLRGRDAVEYLVSTLETVRHPHGRHGEPRVFIGTPADVAFLRFRAVRVMGAVEGVIPGAPREDPILPDAARLWLNERAPGRLLPTSADRVLRQTHEVFLAATAAGERLAVSAARQWVDGTEHELAGAMLETAVALGRPGDGGARELVPSLRSLRRLYVGPGIAARARRDAERPATVRSALGLVARADDGSVHPAWLVPADALFSLSRLRAIAAERESPEFLRSDGFLGPLAAGLSLPGLAPERGISASVLVKLLECPHRYLLESVLSFRPREERLSLREVGQPSYGSLVHRVVERFFRAHGEAFCRRERTLAEWRQLADEAANGCFLEFLREYPLAGDSAVEAQRQRLRREVGYLVRAEWESGTRLVFGDVEVPFGNPAPVPLAVDAGATLHVQGFIDRLDRAPAGLVVRDFKTGRLKAREETDFDPVVDAQIGLYALVASGVMGGEKVARAAYVYPVAAGDSERAFEGAELEELLQRAREWFGLARELLAARSFPHTAVAERCRYCAFQAVCGIDGVAVSRRKLAAAGPSSLAARFAALQRPIEDDDAG